ncbi:MAG TPA: NADH-quinone oxidoreductase subunit J [Solirubrobacteraceae bacterium]|jgi:NADH:ubiquinone oxidoreductase subunit 6 (subunit J)
MSTFVFFVAAIGAITGAVGVIALKNPYYSVLSLVGHMISLAALFLLLRAEFLAASQVIIYAGAVIVLYVFVVSYVGDAAPALGQDPGRLAALGAFACGGALVVELFIAVLGSGLQAIGHDGAPYHAGFGTPGQIGTLLLTRFLAPFEIASYLLLIAAIGAVTLARRRGGLDDGIEGDAPVLELLDVLRPRPAATGTMAEAGGSRGMSEP